MRKTKHILIILLFAPSVGIAAQILEKIPDLTDSKFCENQDQLSDLPKALEKDPVVGRIVISKRFRKLYLVSKRDELIFEAPAAFGFGFAGGAKAFEGDGKTPEGVYFIDQKPKQTAYFKSLRISYPNKIDTAFAKKLNRKPGGLILIHGFPTQTIGDLTPDYVESVHPETDWTQGCIALTNDQIKLVFDLVTIKTPIEICPM